MFNWMIYNFKIYVFVYSFYSYIFGVLIYCIHMYAHPFPPLVCDQNTTPTPPPQQWTGPSFKSIMGWSKLPIFPCENIPSLKQTAQASEKDGWNTIISFLGFGLVLESELKIWTKNKATKMCYHSLKLLVTSNIAPLETLGVGIHEISNLEGLFQVRIC